MEFLEKDIEQFRREFATPRKVVILSHTNPDGDALGSSLALRNVLAGRGHTATVIVPNSYAHYLDWMPGIVDVIVARKDPDHSALRAIAEADVIVCADMNRLDRIDELSEAVSSNTSARRILVDHHLSPDGGFDLSFSHPESSSAALLMLKILEAAYGRECIDVTTATLLYVGIMTDTGNFSYSYLTPELFNAVADLTEKGIDIPTIYNSVYNSFSEGRARLFGYLINRKMKTLQKGTVAYMSLTEEEMRKFWFHQGDSEGFVNYPLTIKKMRMSAMFTEQNGFIRVSLRSRANIDVDTFARRYFNGGGHKNAAGGKSFVSMEETIRHYIESVEEYHAEGLV